MHNDSMCGRVSAVIESAPGSPKDNIYIYIYAILHILVSILLPVTAEKRARENQATSGSGSLRLRT